ncbi:MAG: sugar ABC transporter ATP-binding protein [Lautropia sp.]
MLSFHGMCKAFGGTRALVDVEFDLRRGEILALLGQNGAGKSTLIKILAGVYAADPGEIRLDGRPLDGARRGAVAFIHQDLGLIEWMSVAENIAMAQGYPRRRGVIDWRAVDAAARRSLSMIAYDIDPRRRVSDLTRTEKSLVAIARALGVDARVLVLDEPTASLPQADVALLFDVLRGLKARGVGMIYVSHRLDEVFALSDRLVVLRDGRVVDRRRTAEAEPDALIASIIGRRPDAVYARSGDASTTPLLTCAALAIGDVGPIDFTLHEGEIVALVGLRGAGQEAVGRALVGDPPAAGGVVSLCGRALALSTPTQSIRAGIGFVAADRVAESIAPGLSVRENLFINPSASGRGLWSWRLPADEAGETRALGGAVGLAPNDPDAGVEVLSGGNQQKVVMARWMRIGPRVLVLEDPTAGVDVGARAEIYRLLATATGKGQGVLLVSTDFEEVAAICHRALVFHGGRVVAEIGGTDLSVEAITRATSMQAPAAALPVTAPPVTAHPPATRATAS